MQIIRLNCPSPSTAQRQFGAIRTPQGFKQSKLDLRIELPDNDPSVPVAAIGPHSCKGQPLGLLHALAGAFRCAQLFTPLHQPHLPNGSRVTRLAQFGACRRGAPVRITNICCSYALVPPAADQSALSKYQPRGRFRRHPADRPVGMSLRCANRLAATTFNRHHERCTDAGSRHRVCSIQRFHMSCGAGCVDEPIHQTNTIVGLR